MRHCLKLVIFLFCKTAFSASSVEQFYSSFIRGISANSCKSIEAEMTCQQNSSKNNLSRLQAVSSSVISSRLVSLDNERRACAKSQWDSMNGSAPEAVEMRKIRVEQMNTQLSQLQDIRNQLEDLGRDIIRMPSLAGLQQSRKYSKNKQEVDAKITDAKKELELKEQLAESLLTLYSQKLAEIPNSDTPVVAEFISSRLSYMSKNFKPVTLKEYEIFVSSVSKGFQESTDDLQKSKSGNSYNLSVEERERLATDPTLIAQLAREFPGGEKSIEVYQCQARQHASTKNNFEVGANIASFAVSGGAFLAARAARASFVLRSPKNASLVEKGSRYLGFASLGAGGVEGSVNLVKSCLAENKTQVQGSCILNPKLVIEEFELSSCVWDATLASIPAAIKAGTGVYALKNGSGTTQLSEFVAEMRKKYKKSLDYKFAGKLSDRDRAAAAESVIGRNLTSEQKKAVIEAHKMDPTAYLPDRSFAADSAANAGKYSEASQKKKRDYLVTQGFSEKEARLLGVTGITGNTPEIAAQNMTNGAFVLFKRVLTQNQVDAIWNASSGSRDDKIKKLSQAGFTEDEVQKIISGEFEKSVKASANIALPEPVQSVPVVKTAPLPPTTADKQKILADKFELQDGKAMQSAYDESRKAQIATANNNPELFRSSPAAVFDGTVNGLDTKKSADFIEDFVAASKGGDAGYLKAIGSVDQRIATEASSKSMKSDFNKFKLQELKVEMMERYYTKKYTNKYNEMDMDRFIDEDGDGFDAYTAAKEKLADIVKKAEKSRWPK